MDGENLEGYGELIPTIEMLEDVNFLPSTQDILRVFPGEEGLNFDWILYIDRTYKTIGYEILTKEYMEALTTYLSQRIEVIYQRLNKKVTLLEVGGGTGRLSHFLFGLLENKVRDKFELISTDLVEPEEGLALYRVEALEYKKAVDTYDPAIIISSWMPAEMDWTPAFRENPNVEEYILIGVGQGYTGSRASYLETDGFERREICKNEIQLCFDDVPAKVIRGANQKKSKSVSFVKQKK